jgi:phenylpropionate dioxygenase-like ring-hydroxylating dioxygenase large terminal subunit
MSDVARLAEELALDRNPARSATLPARFYTSPEIFAAEREAIFFRGWQMAGHVSDLAETGSYITANVHDQNVFICRGKDGVLRGFYNVCAHRAHELLSGAGRTAVITCPYHAWSYHLTGELRSARGTERQEGFPGGKICLTPVRVETLGPLVFFNLDAKAPSLESQFPGLKDEFAHYIPGFAGMKRLWANSGVIEANWKVAADNFLECYHCSPAHPAFADMIDLKTYRSICHVRHSTHIGAVGRAQNKAYAVPASAPVQRSAFWFLWPMATINLMPGDMAVTLFWFNPLSPSRTDQRSITYTPDGKSTPVLDDYARYSLSVLQPEDNGLCESVQRGLASRGYRQGRFVADPELTAVSEHAVHHFHSLVAEALGF